MNNYRHGDVSLHSLKEEPKSLIEVKHNGKFVLALGEHTGHRHLLVADAPQDVLIYKDTEGNTVMNVKKPVKVNHEEHKTITIEKGWYIQRQEREHDYFLGETRKVID